MGSDDRWGDKLWSEAEAEAHAHAALRLAAFWQCVAGKLAEQRGGGGSPREKMASAVAEVEEKDVTVTKSIIEAELSAVMGSSAGTGVPVNEQDDGSKLVFHGFPKPVTLTNLRNSARKERPIIRTMCKACGEGMGEHNGDEGCREMQSVVLCGACKRPKSVCDTDLCLTAHEHRAALGQVPVDPGSEALHALGIVCLACDNNLAEHHTGVPPCKRAPEGRDL